MMKPRNRFGALLALLMMMFVLAACASPTAEQTVPDAVETAGAEVPSTGAGEFDEQFINMMVPHHQGAVEMAKIALERAEHQEIKDMASAILSGQETEIQQMKGWKQQWYGSSDTPAMNEMPLLHAMPGMGEAGHPMDMQAEVEALRSAPEPFDQAFIDAMIPHHQSAIDAARLAQEQATRPEIKQLAQAIIDAQQKEIDQMKAWREAWYGSSSSGAGTIHAH